MATRLSHAPMARIRLGLLFAAILSSAGFAARASAQEQPVLEEIIVTSQRRLENVQQVPVSVSPLTGERLDDLIEGGEDIRALAVKVPSLYAESSNGRLAPRFYIRGLGNTDFDLAASQPVSVLVDEVVLENVILKSFPLFDIDRVEVLRGPQGTLFGRNTPAGVVKFDSVQPTKNFEGYGSLSVGNYTTINAEGALNVPISQQSALRFSLLNQTRNDWVHNTVPTGLTQDFEGYRDSAFRAQWLLEAGQDFWMLANVHARDLNGSARLFRANIIQPGTNDLVPGFDETKISTDGKNEQTLTNVGTTCASAGGWAKSRCIRSPASSMSRRTAAATSTAASATSLRSRPGPGSSRSHRKPPTACPSISNGRRSSASSPPRRGR